MTKEEQIKIQEQKVKILYEKYGLDKEDVYRSKNYLIITRQGIEKIQGQENLKVKFDVIRCEPDYAVFKAYNNELETFGSAKHGDFKNGNTITWYVAEMAEKRALSRFVLKATKLYELGFFGEDESEIFSKNKESKTPEDLREQLIELTKSDNYQKKMSFEDMQYIERIIDEKEEKAYLKAINTIKNQLK